MHIFKIYPYNKLPLTFTTVCVWGGFNCFRNTDLIGISRATIRKYFADHSRVYTYFITSVVYYRRVMNTQFRASNFYCVKCFTFLSQRICIFDIYFGDILLDHKENLRYIQRYIIRHLLTHFWMHCFQKISKIQLTKHFLRRAGFLQIQIPYFLTH